MNKLKAVIQYDGSSYHGWQFQPGVPTIQGEIERVLLQIFRRPIRVFGAGRTDAGVHAFGQVAHFLVDWSHELQKLQKALNSLLAPDICIIQLDNVSDDFHARHKAISKTYRYVVLNKSVGSPFHRLYSFHVPQELDLELMNSASSAFIGAHDFAAFGAPTDGTPSTVREIYSASWNIEPGSGLMIFSITGSGFLRYMVRTVVATLIRVGKNQISPERVKIILDSRDRSLAIGKASPHGLYLDHVTYPEDSGTLS
ncbi:MAG: tRNA pseudouridine(38-40) synthase TruA [Syntrophaceae bacterium]|nr:tRNA pseudouridine(38-40) synthase TruA [Syntrophaceae bacterium]